MKTKLKKALLWILWGDQENPLPAAEQGFLLLVGAIVGAIAMASFLRLR